jgi:dimethylhistidine N-methyltransferase
MSAILPTPLRIDAPKPTAEDFLADVQNGLRASAKRLPCKYFYDDAGSALFERITELPEYYLTRTELGIMRAHARHMTALLGRNCLLIEFGSGSSLKTRLLLDHLRKPAGYIPIDISGEHLERASLALVADYPGIEVLPLCADFTRPVELPHTIRPPRARAVYFPGSTIGNFLPRDAVRMLCQAATLTGPGGGMLLGADLKKDPNILHAAYNDTLGVTALFNRNILVRMNRELGADFRVERFYHYAFYNARHGRVEMHLVSQGAQRVHVGGEEFALADGESIRTECSYKYNLADLRHMAARAGFEVRNLWTDERNYFAILYLTTSPGSCR